jgi:hypothetical protein
MSGVAKRARDGEVLEPIVDGWVRPPLCVFCSAPWTDDMLKVSAEVELEDGYYGDTYLTGAGIVSVDINCSTCKRLVYRKEIRCTNVERQW